MQYQTADQQQLNLPLNHTENSLTDYFEKHLGKPLSLKLTENSSSMLSVRIDDSVLRVRLHRMFLTADDAVIGEILSYLKTRKGGMPCFHQFVRGNRHRLPAKTPKRIAVKTAGKVYDLRELYDDINGEYFGGTITAVITWGSRSPRSSVRKRTLGSYSESSNIIRINPLLDRKTVPRFYVAFVVYHEMLHAAIGISRKGERRSVHGSEFRKREKLFKDYERATAWEDGR